jgi:hypothetical protein
MLLLPTSLFIKFTCLCGHGAWRIYSTGMELLIIPNGILLWYFELASYLLKINNMYYLIPYKCMSCICLVVSNLWSVEENPVNIYFPIARKA